MTTISFTGDIAFSKYFKDAWKDPTFIDNDVVSVLRNSDPYAGSSILPPGEKPLEAPADFHGGAGGDRVFRGAQRRKAGQSHR